MTARVLPMFPLGSVLVPGMALPLRVFEPRYRAMLDDLDATGSNEFGVVLIERGSEVGGGDERALFGCEAQIIELVRGADGTAELLAVGTGVIEVDSWLPDDPYPRARVRAADRAEPRGGERDVVVALLATVESAVASIVAMAFEMGLSTTPSPPELADDPWQRIDELSILLPLGPLDRYRVLATDDASTAAGLLADMAAEQELILRARYDERG